MVVVKMDIINELSKTKHYISLSPSPKELKDIIG
jgi:hypothetical protein